MNVGVERRAGADGSERGAGAGGPERGARAGGLERGAGAGGLERGAGVGGLGDSLAVFGEERWVVVHDAARDPQPLRALVLLDRRRSAQSEARLEPEASALAIIGAALDSGPWIERRRARFELLADLVRDTPVLRLVAGVDVPPAALAELVESAMDRAAGS
jgi:hypothetical protein